MLVIQTTGKTNDTSLPLLVRDPLLTGSNGGVSFLFDLGFTAFSYPSAANPVSGSLIYDVAENGLTGSFNQNNGDTTNYAGGGFDFSNCAYNSNFIQIPSSAASGLYDANQYYLIVFYVRFPASADWSNQAYPLPMLQFATGATGFVSTPDIVTIGYATYSGTNVFSARRQTAIGTTDNIQMNATSVMYGNVAQVAFWRNGASQTLQITSGAGMMTQSISTGSNNTANYSSQTAKIGITPSFWNSTLTSTELNARKFRVYRGWFENLTTSGRDPKTVLSQDWTRTIARGVFS